MKHIDVIIVLACSLAGAAVMATYFDSGVLGNDFAQTVSVARSLLEGKGLTTDLIYYDIHYSLGGDRVAQTVFPPGHAVLLALLMLPGISAYSAAFLLSLGAHIMTTLLLTAVLRRLGTGHVVAILGSITWFLAGLNWASVLLCRSEVLFTLMTVLGLYFFVRWNDDSANSRRFLYWLGLSAGSAFLIRYQGLFVIAGFGAWFGIRFLALRSRPAFVDAAAYGAIPVFLVLATLAYNAAVTGGIGGGPVDHAAHSAGLSEVALGFYYEICRILGVSRDGLLALRPGDVFLVVLLLFCVFAALRYRIGAGYLRAIAATPAAGFCLAYVVVSVAALAYLALTKSTGYLQARYLATLLPFIIVLLAIGLVQARRLDIPQPVRRTGAALALGFLVFGQVQAVSEQLDFVAADSRLQVIRDALEAGYLDGTVKSYLQAEIDAGENVLANQSQLLGHLLDRPTFGFTPSLYSARIFDAREVAAMAGQYNLEYVLLFPPLYDGAEIQNSNRVILTELADNVAPGWITPVIMRPEIRVYRIEGGPTVP